MTERYLKEAEALYQKAWEELAKGKEDGDPLKVRDAAEKAWNAIVQATNFLLVKRGLPLLQSHIERRKALGELSRKDPKIEELGLRDRFMARCQSLHEECFCEGYCPVDLLEKEFNKVKDYLEDIKKI